MRYIKEYTASTQIQQDLDNGVLGKPYMASVNGIIDWNTKSPQTGPVLPSKSFVCNYNAKNYNADTKVFPKTEGQLFDEDLVLYTNFFTRIQTHIEDGYVTFTGSSSLAGISMVKQFASPEENPFFRTNDNKNLTVVFKTTQNTNSTVLGIEGTSGPGGAQNWRVDRDGFYTSGNSYTEFSPNEYPAIQYYRINNDGALERKCVTTGQIDTASTVNFSGETVYACFFTNNPNKISKFRGDFYWLYVSTETLTDEEIEQVINYNENLE